MANFLCLTTRLNNELFLTRQHNRVLERNSPSFLRFLLVSATAIAAAAVVAVVMAGHYALLFCDYFYVEGKRRERENHIHRGRVADNKAHYAPRQDISPRVECTRILSVSRSTRKSRTLVLQTAKVGPLREGRRTQKPGGD